MVRLLRFAACALLLAALPVIAGERVALVVGNGAYVALKPLKNPVNDATDIGAALEELGFRVMLGTDLDRKAMANLVRRFADAARMADASLFYYAGHGFQIDDRNYLVPVDAMLERPQDVGGQALALDEILGDLEQSAGARLVFLDACRDNPLRKEGEAAGPALRDGLAKVGEQRDFLFAFATHPGGVAWDGVGRNSIFTEAVLNNIATPGQDIGDMMVSVRKEVLHQTGGKQVPWENTSLTERFFFDPSPVKIPPEMMLWQVAARAQDQELIRVYLASYPDGTYASDAHEFLELARAEPADAEHGQTRSLPPQDASSVPEERLWDLARQTRLRPLVRAYLERFPEGRYRREAEALLNALPDQAVRDATPELLCERLATHPDDATPQAPGVSWTELERQSGAAVDACLTATVAQPDLPHYVALLARATLAAGHREESLRLYREAAEGGDLRALHSLGYIHELGIGVPADPIQAISYYQRAADGGLFDATLELARMLVEGQGVSHDPERAVELMERAAADGHAEAMFNLGVLALRGIGDGMQAIDHFRAAAERGYGPAYRAAAIVLDEGRGTESDSEGAAEMLLRAVAADDGRTLHALVSGDDRYSDDTLRAMQRRLAKAELYGGAIDGLLGPRMRDALARWRNGGLLEAVAA